MSVFHRLLGRSADERGFTLIELSVAVGLFGILLISMSLLFESGFETTNTVRFSQRAKTLAQEKMEEVRALPFYISQSTNTDPVDILDRYFPDDQDVNPTPTGAVGTYDDTTDVWTFTSTETINEADAPTFTRTVAVQFVVVASDGTVTPRPPIPGYDSKDSTADMPATSTLQVTVAVGWVFRGQDRSVSLNTLITRSGEEALKVQASGSIMGAQVSGLTFQDGDGLDGVAADVLAMVGRADTTFREVTDSSAQVLADAVEVIERDPVTNVPLQDPAPSPEGEASATAPNASTGNQQQTSSGLSAGTMSATDPVSGVIASWGAVSPAASAEARVSKLHSLNPESRADVEAGTFLLNGRKPLAVPHLVFEVGLVGGQIEQTSTLTESQVISTVTLSDVAIWGWTDVSAEPGPDGTVKIDEVKVETEALANAVSPSVRVEWTVTQLWVWDPGDPDDPDDGEYVGPWTFGFTSGCGGWVDDPNLCGPDRTDGLEPTANPNPVVIPQAYAGTDPTGAEALSLSITAGATLRESVTDAATGVSSATAAQKNVLSITLRDDIAGAVELEPMVVLLGAANASVSYVAHEH